MSSIFICLFHTRYISHVLKGFNSKSLRKVLVNKLNNQNQVFRFLYVIWPKSKNLYPTYLMAIKPPSV